jgi:NAD(P)-dependent dehydrogenase (short-subunit alcohol dehydrogenase family)
MEIATEEMMKVYEINVAGCLKVTQTFMPLVQASWRRPTIVNISSPLGSLELNKGGVLAPYRCSKAALNMLTRSFALEMPSVVFLSVSPRNWNYIPVGTPWTQNTEKQDKRYGSIEEGVLRASQQLSNFEEDAAKIVTLCQTVKKEDSGFFFYPDGERVPY